MTTTGTTTTATVDSDGPPPQLTHSLPIVDLHLLSQSDLYSLSKCSNSSFDPNRCDDVVIPKIDRSVFNESAGSRKQTYSKLRLAPADSAPSSKTTVHRRTHHLRAPHSLSVNDVNDSEQVENSRIISLFKELFKSNPKFNDLALIEVQNCSNFESLNPVIDNNSNDLGSTEAENESNFELLNSEIKRKGRRKHENVVLLSPPAAKRICSNNIVKKEVVYGNDLDVETVNCRGVKVDIENLARLEDPYGPEIRRRTEGILTSDELLGFLRGLNGDWGTARKKRRVVDASDFGDFLPNGWKLSLCIKRKEGRVWLFCCHYISPGGRQFESCKDISMYLLSIAGEENLDKHHKQNHTHSNSYDDSALNEASGNAADIFVQEDLKENSPLLITSPPPICLPTHCEKQVPVDVHVEEPSKIDLLDHQILAHKDERSQHSTIPDNDMDLETVNCRGVKVNMANLARLEDPYGPEINRRTEGLSTADELLGFLRGVNGEWGTARKKRRVVDASDFGDFLPKGWRLSLCIKRKGGRVWLFCRRYISPSGRQFESCKDVSIYLLSIVKEENLDKPNDTHSNSCDNSALNEASGNAADLFVQDNIKQNNPLPNASKPPIFVPANEKQVPLYVQIEELFKCLKCFMLFEGKINLLDHQALAHKNESSQLDSAFCDYSIVIGGVFDCRFCRKTFYEKKQYNEHIESHVTNENKTSENVVREDNDTHFSDHKISSVMESKTDEPVHDLNMIGDVLGDNEAEKTVDCLFSPLSNKELGGPVASNDQDAVSSSANQLMSSNVGVGKTVVDEADVSVDVLNHAVSETRVSDTHMCSSFDELTSEKDIVVNNESEKLSFFSQSDDASKAFINAKTQPLPKQAGFESADQVRFSYPVTSSKLDGQYEVRNTAFDSYSTDNKPVNIFSNKSGVTNLDDFQFCSLAPPGDLNEQAFDFQDDVTGMYDRAQDSPERGLLDQFCVAETSDDIFGLKFDEEKGMGVHELSLSFTNPNDVNCSLVESEIEDSFDVQTDLSMVNNSMVENQGRTWEDFRSDEFRSFEDKKFMIGSGSNQSQQCNEVVSCGMLKTAQGNQLQSGLVNSPHVQIQSPSFHSFDIMSDKAEDGLFGVNERYNKSLNVSELRSNRSEPVEYRFLTGRTELNPQHAFQTVSRSFPYNTGIEQPFDSNYWMGKHTMMPTSVCAWCRNEFELPDMAIHQQTQGGVGSLCPTCSAGFSGQPNML